MYQTCSHMILYSVDHSRATGIYGPPPTGPGPVNGSIYFAGLPVIFWEDRESSLIPGRVWWPWHDQAFLKWEKLNFWIYSEFRTSLSREQFITWWKSYQYFWMEQICIYHPAPRNEWSTSVYLGSPCHICFRNTVLGPEFLFISTRMQYIIKNLLVEHFECSIMWYPLYI